MLTTRLVSNLENSSTTTSMLRRSSRSLALTGSSNIVASLSYQPYRHPLAPQAHEELATISASRLPPNASLSMLMEAMEKSSRSVHAQIGPHLLSLGSTGFTFKLNKYIVVKKVRPGRDCNMANERTIFDILERHPPSPYIVRSFYRTEEAIFLEYATNGDLASLLREEQQRDESSQQVIGVVRRQPLERCFRWMKQLGAAAAWLEELGLAHCDIRPGNMLLYPAGHVKLADFDRTLKTGEDMLSGTEPFARLLGDEGGPDRGTYGKAGCRTEQFAIGSVFYSLTRGYDPFEDQWWGPDHGPIRMQKLQKMELPRIGHLECDGVIWSCWHGRYKSITKLATDIAAVDGHAWRVTCEEDPLWVKARTHESETIARSGILEQLITC